MNSLISPTLLIVLGLSSFFAKNVKLKRLLNFLISLLILVNLLLSHTTTLALVIFLFVTFFNLAMENVDLKEKKTIEVQKKNRHVKALNLFLGVSLIIVLSLFLGKSESLKPTLSLDRSEIYNAVMFLFLAFSFLKGGSSWKA